MESGKIKCSFHGNEKWQPKCDCYCLWQMHLLLHTENKQAEGCRLQLCFSFLESVLKYFQDHMQQSCYIVLQNHIISTIIIS